MKLFLIFAFGLVLALDSASAWICPEKDGFFSNPTNPHKFYECVNGHDYEYTCPSNLVFNESIKMCDYTLEPSHQSPVPATPPSTRGLFICPSPNGVFGDDHNPYIYHECFNGHDIKHNCPEDLIFIKSRNMCDDPIFLI